MGGSVSRTNFTFSYTDEPHATRRKLILQKYPQVKKLMTVDHQFKWQVVALVLGQLFSFYLLRNTTNFWLLAFFAYFVGGVANHALMLAIHEISHAMGFGPGRPVANKLLGMFANLPIGAPVSISFKKYHLDHHRYQGDEKLDTDIPTFLEVKLFQSIPSKLIWCFLQPFFYTLRPFCVNPKKVEMFELINIVVQLTFDYIIYKTLGLHIVLYMLAGSALAMGLHPVAGHFISEHFLIFPDGKKLHDQQLNSDNYKIDSNDKYNSSNNNLVVSNGNSSSRHSPSAIKNRSLLPRINEDDEDNTIPNNNNNNKDNNKSSINQIKQNDFKTSTTNSINSNLCANCENQVSPDNGSTLDIDGQFLVPETCSYYGPLNMLTFNVGYHVEHHDFPSIPGSKLKELQKIAPEFYLTLNYHTSWVKVLWQYVTDPRVGPSARVRRPHKFNIKHNEHKAQSQTTIAAC